MKYKQGKKAVKYITASLLLVGVLAGCSTTESLHTLNKEEQKLAKQEAGTAVAYKTYISHLSEVSNLIMGLRLEGNTYSNFDKDTLDKHKKELASLKKVTAKTVLTGYNETDKKIVLGVKEMISLLDTMYSDANNIFTDTAIQLGEPIELEGNTLELKDKSVINSNDSYLAYKKGYKALVKQYSEISDLTLYSAFYLMDNSDDEKVDKTKLSKKELKEYQKEIREDSAEQLTLVTELDYKPFQDFVTHYEWLYLAETPNYTDNKKAYTKLKEHIDGMSKALEPLVEDDYLGAIKINKALKELDSNKFEKAVKKEDVVEIVNMVDDYTDVYYNQINSMRKVVYKNSAKLVNSIDYYVSTIYKNKQELEMTE